MKNATLESFAALLEDVGNALIRAARYGLRAVATMSWPNLLVTCVALALAITILPLALVLFVVFMALKLAVAACVLGARRRHNQPTGHAE